MMGPIAEIVKITPELATEWLGHNTHNRNARATLVDAYARDMSAGSWVLNGDSIKRATNGAILDGQHRLLAVAKSGVTIESIVISGLPVAAQDTVDTGARRSFADLLALHGEPNCYSLAATTRMVYLWTNGLFGKGGWKTTNADLLKTLERFGDIRESARVGDQVRRQKIGVGGGPISLCHWLFNHIDPDDASYFFARLGDGVNLQQDDPIYVLRRTIVERQTAHSRLQDPAIVAYIIKAWNAYRDGRSITLLRYRPGGASPESFPEPH